MADHQRSFCVKFALDRHYLVPAYCNSTGKCGCSKEFNSAVSAVLRGILQRDLKIYPYKVMMAHELSDREFSTRTRL